MQNLKKEVVFLDAENHRARLNVEITNRNGYPEFTMSGTFLNSGGQIIDHIKPANGVQEELIKLWKKHHLENVSNLPNFREHVLKTIELIEQAEASKEDKELTGDEAILENMEQEGISEDSLDAVKAYMEVMNTEDLSDFEEAYQGTFRDDEDFARETAESLGEIDRNAHWPNNCIDWEQAARELMQDYSEQDGFYFRNL